MSGEVSLSYFRFAEVAIFCANAVMTLLTSLQYVSIPEVTATFYDTQAAIVSWTSIVYCVSNALLTLFGSLFVEKNGIRFSLLTCSLLNCIGNGLNCGSVDRSRFYMTLVGQGIASISQVFILILPSRIAGLWFEADFVSTATAATISSIAVGKALGLLLPRYIVVDTKDQTILGESMQIMHYYYLGASTLIFLLTVLVARDKPPSAPSKAATMRNNNGQEMNVRFCSRIGSLTESTFFNLHLIAFAFNTAVNYWYIDAFKILATMFFEGSEKEIDWIVFYISISGAVLCLLSGLLMDKTRSYKTGTIVTYAASIIGIAIFSIVLRLTSNPIWLYLPASFTACAYPYMVIAYELGAEMTYPENEHVMSGITVTATWLVVLILNPIVIYIEYFVPHAKAIILISTLGGILIIGLVLTVFVKPIYRRQAAEDRTFTSGSAQSTNNDQDYTRF